MLGERIFVRRVERAIVFSQVRHDDPKVLGKFAEIRLLKLRATRKTVQQYQWGAFPVRLIVHLHAIDGHEMTLGWGLS